MRTHGWMVAAIALGPLVSGCSKPQAAEPAPAPPVKTQIVTTMRPASAIRYSASIEAFEQVTLSFKSSGYVDDVLQRRGADGRSRAAQAGDQVAKGTVLARVREADFRDRVNQGKARLAEADAAGTKARLDLERARTLFQSDSVTKPELDAAQAAFDTAEARITSARLDIELATSALRDCALVAPSAGVILERRIEIGTLAAAGTVGFVIGDLRSVKARFGVPDAMVPSIRLGDAIAVSVEAMAGTKFAGRVTAIAPAADAQSRVFDVEVTVANQDGRLRPGMIGTVAIDAAAATTAAAHAPLAVPLTAVVRGESGTGDFAVLVIEKHNGADVARVRRVELGEVMGNDVAISNGLHAGEQVVVSGATLLANGTAVRVVE